MLAVIACSKKDERKEPSNNKQLSQSKQKPVKTESELPEGIFLLSQAQFVYEDDGVGGQKPLPGPARLEIISTRSGQVTSEVIEDSQSNVFHKTMSGSCLGFPDRLVTIGANEAFLKLWQRDQSGTWTATSLWNPVFGGKHNRLRDIEIGDVTGDDKPEIVMATHDQGVIAVLQGEQTTWQATELGRTEKTFVHEIEIGDVNGNGTNEFYTTPSAPNKMDGTPQPGRITGYEYRDGHYVSFSVEEFPERHVKEILVGNLTTNSAHPVLFAAIEAETTKSGDSESIVDPVKIKQYCYRDGTYQGIVIAELSDRQCRFLMLGDVNGDQTIDMIAAGFKSGLWLLEQPDADAGTEQWTKTLIDADSSGYEHATVLFDLDGDGTQEIYVAADDQRALSQYRWDGQRFVKTTIASIKDHTITFGLMVQKSKP